MRKSFIIHFDALDVLNELTDEQAGMLFKAISEYQRTGTNSLSGMMNAVFIPFKNQFDRDAQKYDAICERNRNNGLKGGRPKPRRTQKTQSVILGTQKNPNKPDNKNDNDSKNKKEAYAYEGNVIRLVERDFDEWEKRSGMTFNKFMDFLNGRDKWYSTQPPQVRKNWFFATSQILAGD